MQEGGIILQEYALASGGVWFVRLDVCIPLDIFAVGNSWGQARYSVSLAFVAFPDICASMQVFVYPLSTFKNRYANLLDEKEKVKYVSISLLRDEMNFCCA